MLIKFNTDGSIAEQLGSNIFQYSSGANTIEIQINKPQDSLVTISLVQDNLNQLIAKPCVPKLDSGTSAWVYTFSNSDLSIEGDLQISFTITKGGTSLNTETINGIVQTSFNNGFTPIDPETEETIFEWLTKLEINKVDRFSVSDENLPFLPPNITYDKNGRKTPNVFYTDYINNIYEYDLSYLENIKGALFVVDTPNRQNEFFFADPLKIQPKLYTRVVYYDENGAVTSATQFVEIGRELYESLDSRITNISNQLTNKQDKVDNSLNTTSKAVVGAINEVNTNKLDKNFNLLVERTFAQLTDWVAVRSGDQTLKMTLQTLRTYLTQGLVGLSFQIMEELPPAGVGNIVYLTPIVDSIEHVETYNDLPTTGEVKTLYVVDDEHTSGTTGWYVWSVDTEEYVAYNLGFEEYIWIEELEAFELIGSTQVDLTGYATETWVTNNFIAKSILNGGTTGQILAKKSDNDLDFEFVDKPQAPIQEIQLNGVEVPPVDGVVDLEVPIISLNGVDYIRDPDKTYLVVKTSTDNDTFQLLRFSSAGTNNFVIEWGDGQSETVTTTGNLSHVYEKFGLYLITISGIFDGMIWVNNNATHKDKYIEVYFGNNIPSNINIHTAGGAFYGCTNLTIFSAGDVLTSWTTSGSGTGGNGLFRGCVNLRTIDIRNIVNIRNISSWNNRQFEGCTNLRTLVLSSNLDLSLVSDTHTMFSNVKLNDLIINGDTTDAKVLEIRNKFSTNGGTLLKSCEIKYGLQVEKTPTLPNDVVRKQDQTAVNNTYNNTTSGLTATNVQDAIDELDNIKLDINGGIMTGDLDMSGGTIKGLANAVNSNEAVNKGQLDSALASASGLTLSDNLDSPSSTVGLSTKGANDLLEKKPNKINLDITMNSSNNNVEIYTEPNGNAIQNQLFTIIYGVRNDLADPIVYNSLTFEIVDNTTKINTTYITTHYTPNPTSPTSITELFGGIQIDTSGTIYENLRVQLRYFNGSTTTFPHQLILRDLIVYSKE